MVGGWSGNFFAYYLYSSSFKLETLHANQAKRYIVVGRLERGMGRGKLRPLVLSILQSVLFVMKARSWSWSWSFSGKVLFNSVSRSRLPVTKLIVSSF